MTQDQIEIYEVCKKDLEDLKLWKTKLPFGVQKHGISSRSPAIYGELEKIHYDMYINVVEIINNAIKKLENKIEKL